MVCIGICAKPIDFSTPFHLASKSLRSDPCDVAGQDVAHHRAGVEGEEAGHGHEIFAGHEETPVDPVHV